MAKVLVEGSKVTCGTVAPHQGTLSMKGVSRLVLNDRKVLTTESVAQATLSPDAPCTNPGNAGGPCTELLPISNGASTLLKVDGVAVVLQTLAAQTDKQSPIRVDPLAINNDLLRVDQ